MAVVNTNGSGYDNSGQSASLQSQDVPASLAEGKVRCVTSLVPVGNGDSIGSKYFVGKIPSDAIIDPASVVIADAIANLSSVDLGFAVPPGQPATIPGNPIGAGTAHLLAAVDWHVGGSFSLVTGITAANLGKRAWQLAGFTFDPGGVLDVVATVKNATTAAGNLLFSLRYVRGH